MTQTGDFVFETRSLSKSFVNVQAIRHQGFGEV